MRHVLALALAGVVALVGCANRTPPCTATSTDCPRVLFIGNSYTAVNNLPATLSAMMTQAGHPVYTEMIAPGGARLADHLANDDVIRRIADGRWTFVVLQEQSLVPSVARSRDTEMFPAARQLAQVIRNAGARTVLYETWGRRDGWPDGGFGDFASMQRALTASYRTIADELHALIAPVGEAWQQELLAHPGAALWQPDGSHPTMAGTAIAARVLAAAMFPEVRLK